MAAAAAASTAPPLSVAIVGWGDIRCARDRFGGTPTADDACPAIAHSRRTMHAPPLHIHDGRCMSPPLHPAPRTSPRRSLPPTKLVRARRARPTRRRRYADPLTPAACGARRSRQQHVRALLAIPGAAAVSCVVSAHASRAEVGPEAAPPFETLANPGAARPGAALAPALR
jgi:hypothetical protein